MKSTTARLREGIDALVEDLAALVQELKVKDNRFWDSEIIYVAPDWAWDDPSKEQRARQLSLKRRYDVLSERLTLLVSGAPDELTDQLRDADEGIRRWIELESNWHLSPDAEANVRALREDAAAIGEVLGVLERVAAGESFVIPDTNSMLQAPDPTAYRGILEGAFVFTLLPTVLGELDHLKTEHRNPEVRDKAKGVINRIKGWRHQGSLAEGVTVDKSILVRALHAEPDMAATLTWLDASVPDDRVIASVLALQSERPGATVVLVTSDINLLNKADAALIQSTEPPAS